MINLSLSWKKDLRDIDRERYKRIIVQLSILTVQGFYGGIGVESWYKPDIKHMTDNKLICRKSCCRHLRKVRRLSCKAYSICAIQGGKSASGHDCNLKPTLELLHGFFYLWYNGFENAKEGEDMENKIKVFENKQVRTVWDANAEEWYFSVVDVVAELTDSKYGPA